MAVSSPVVPNRWAIGRFQVGHGAVSHFDMFKFAERGVEHLS